MPDPKQKKIEFPKTPLPPLPAIQMQRGTRTNAKKREAGMIKRTPPPAPTAAKPAVPAGHEGFNQHARAEQRAMLQKFIADAAKNENAAPMTKAQSMEIVKRMDDESMTQAALQYYAKDRSKLDRIKDTRAGKILIELMKFSMPENTGGKGGVKKIRDTIDKHTENIKKLYISMKKGSSSACRIIEDEGFVYFAAKAFRKYEEKSENLLSRGYRYTKKKTQKVLFGQKAGAATPISAEMMALAKSGQSDWFYKVVRKTDQLGELDDADRKSGTETRSKKGTVYETFAGAKSTALDPTSGLLETLKVDHLSFKAIKLAIDGVELIIKDVKLCISLYKNRDKLKGVTDSSGKKAKVDETPMEISNHLNTIGQNVKYVCDIMSAARDSLKIAGPIGQLVSHLIFGLPKLYTEMKAFTKAKKNTKRMRTQKDAIKEKLYGYQSQYSNDFPAIVKRRTDGTYAIEYKGQIMDRNQERKDKYIASLKAEWAKSKGGTGTAKEKQQREQDQSKFIGLLEDYSVTKELTEANVHRKRDGLFNIIVDDIGGIVSSIVMLAGPASPAGNILSLVLTSLSGARSLGFYVRKLCRHFGWFGADQNKRDSSKYEYRHNLAVITYERLRDMIEPEQTLDRMDKDPDNFSENDRKFVDEYLPQRIDLRDQIKSMGVNKEQLHTADSRRKMLEIMRGGFYATVK